MSNKVIADLKICTLKSQATEFKRSLGERHGNDDVLVIYSGNLNTLDTIGYSSSGITIDAKSLLLGFPTTVHLAHH
jgi:hypothetical protein